MRALQCFLMEFWDLSTRGLEAYLPQAALDGLQGGWCVEMPQRTRICHLRWCALESGTPQTLQRGRLSPALVRLSTEMLMGLHSEPKAIAMPGGLHGLTDPLALLGSSHLIMLGCHLLCVAVYGSNDGDVLVDVLLPRMAVLGAQPQDILVLNFGVWIDHEQASIGCL